MFARVLHLIANPLLACAIPGDRASVSRVRDGFFTHICNGNTYRLHINFTRLNTLWPASSNARKRQKIYAKELWKKTGEHLTFYVKSSAFNFVHKHLHDIGLHIRVYITWCY